MRLLARFSAAALLAGLLCAGAAIAAQNGLEPIRALAAKGRLEAAGRQVDRYLEQHPKDAEAALLKGVIESRQGHLQQAIHTFERLTSEHPGMPEPLNNLAVLYAARGQFEQARAALLRATRLDPDYELAQRNLGDVYIKLAAIAYARVLKLDANDAQAHQTLTVLGKLLDERHRSASQAAAGERPAAAQSSTDAGPTAVARSSSGPGDRPAVAARKELGAHASAADADSARACLTIGAFTSKARLAPVRSWIERRGGSTQPRRAAKSQVTIYRVLLPPLPTRAAANARVAQLKQRGIRDVALVSGSDGASTISLGVYGSRANAERRLAELERLGYEAKAETMEVTRAAWWLDAVVTGDEAQIAQEFRHAFPGKQLEARPCAGAS